MNSEHNTKKVVVGELNFNNLFFRQRAYNAAVDKSGLWRPFRAVFRMALSFKPIILHSSVFPAKCVKFYAKRYRVYLHSLCEFKYAADGFVTQIRGSHPGS